MTPLKENCCILFAAKITRSLFRSLRFLFGVIHRHYLSACIFCSLSSFLNTSEASLDFCIFLSFFFNCSVVCSILGLFLLAVFFVLITCLTPKCLQKVPLFLISLPLVQNLAVVDALSSYSIPPRSLLWWWYLPWNFHSSLLNPLGKGNSVGIHFSFYCVKGLKDKESSLCILVLRIPLYSFCSCFLTRIWILSPLCLIAHLSLPCSQNRTEGFHLELAQDTQIPVIW